MITLTILRVLVYSSAILQRHGIRRYFPASSIRKNVYEHK